MPSNSNKGAQPNNQLPSWTPQYLQGLSSQQFPAQPGIFANLARDMAAGGYGTNAENLAWLENVFPPAMIMRSTPPSAPTASSPITPASPINPTTQQQPKTPVRRGYYDRGGGR